MSMSECSAKPQSRPEGSGIAGATDPGWQRVPAGRDSRPAEATRISSEPDPPWLFACLAGREEVTGSVPRRGIPGFQPGNRAAGGANRGWLKPRSPVTCAPRKTWRAPSAPRKATRDSSVRRNDATRRSRRTGRRVEPGKSSVSAMVGAGTALGRGPSPGSGRGPDQPVARIRPAAQRRRPASPRRSPRSGRRCRRGWCRR